MEIMHFYCKKRILCRKKEKPLRRAHWSQKYLKNYDKLIILFKNAFYEEKKSACGARTGLKNKKKYEKMIIT